LVNRFIVAQTFAGLDNVTRQSEKTWDRADKSGCPNSTGLRGYVISRGWLRHIPHLRVPDDGVGSLHADFGPGISVGSGKRFA